MRCDITTFYLSMFVSLNLCIHRNVIYRSISCNINHYGLLPVFFNAFQIKYEPHESLRYTINANLQNEINHAHVVFESGAICPERITASYIKPSQGQALSWERAWSPLSPWNATSLVQKGPHVLKLRHKVPCSFTSLLSHHGQPLWKSER